MGTTSATGIGSGNGLLANPLRAVAKKHARELAARTGRAAAQGGPQNVHSSQQRITL